MQRQVIAKLTHRGDGFGIDDSRRPRPGALRLNRRAAKHPRKRFRHLAPIGVLDADKQHSLYVAHVDSRGGKEQQPASRTHRQAGTANAAPIRGALR